MRVVLFGATGMIGSGVLRECLEDSGVTGVLVLGRAPCGEMHPKLEEALHQDFFDYSGLRDRLTGLDACFFCLGVSSAGMKEEAYHRLTYDLTLEAARVLLELNPELVFCFVSGAGTDSTEQGRLMWARVKGKTENELLRLPFKSAYMFRPGYVQPLKGVRSRTRLYQAMYTVFGPLYPLWKRLFPRHVTTTETIGKAMLEAVVREPEKRILEVAEINALADGSLRTNVGGPQDKR